jgi:hypothetical protein
MTAVISHTVVVLLLVASREPDAAMHSLVNGPCSMDAHARACSIDAHVCPCYHACHGFVYQLSALNHAMRKVATRSVQRSSAMLARARSFLICVIGLQGAAA